MNLKTENSGGNCSYYRVTITHPKTGEPYVAECEDIIAALNMNFQEGEIFKADWRKAAQRTLGIGKEGNTEIRDAEKMSHYGARELARLQALGTPVLDEIVKALWTPTPLSRSTNQMYAEGQRLTDWNSPDKLPPVGCPLLIKRGEEVVLVERVDHVANKDDYLVYVTLADSDHLPKGVKLSGRCEWTYP